MHCWFGSRGSAWEKFEVHEESKEEEDFKRNEVREEIRGGGGKEAENIPLTGKQQHK